MNRNTRDRDREPKRPFLTMIDQDMLDAVREIASTHRISVAHFLRESIHLNLSFYKRRGGSIE